MTPESIISRSATGSAIFPKRDSTCQRRARKPSIWSVTPAMSQTIPAGHVCASPACTMKTTKSGIRARRPSVSAFGSWASGAGTARVAILDDCTGRSGAGMEAAGPVRRAHQIRRLRGRAGEPPGAVVAAVAAMRSGRFDLRPLAPLVVARDRHQVRARGERRRPEVVVRQAVAARAEDGRLTGADAVVAGADARCAEQVNGVRLGAEANELAPAVVDEVVGVEAVEAGGGGESDELGAGEEAERRGHLQACRCPVGRGDVARVVHEDVA